MYTVKQARQYAELSQRQAAEALGVNIDTYRKMERDPESTTIKRAKAFCKIVGIGIDEIFFDAPSTESRDSKATPLEKAIEELKKLQ